MRSARVLGHAGHRIAILAASAAAGFTAATGVLLLDLFMSLWANHNGQQEQSHLNYMCTERFREATGLGLMMPVYMNIVCSVTKPVVNLIVFGPPRPGTPLRFSFKEAVKRDMVTTLRLGLIFLMLSTLVKDMMQVKTAACTPGMSFWERFNAIVVVLTKSPNMSAAMSAWGLEVVYKCSACWTKYHEHQEVAEDVTDMMLRTQGGFFVIYQRILLSVYLPICAFVAAWTLPADAAYNWFVFLIVCVLMSTHYFFVQHLSGTPSRIDESETKLLSASLTSDEQHQCIKSLREIAEYNFITSPFSYRDQKNTFHTLGVTLTALHAYLFMPIVFGNLLPIMAVVSARFYSGCGYLGTLKETWDDRHFMTYASAVANETVSLRQLVWTWF